MGDCRDRGGEWRNRLSEGGWATGREEAGAGGWGSPGGAEAMQGRGAGQDPGWGRKEADKGRRVTGWQESNFPTVLPYTFLLFPHSRVRARLRALLCYVMLCHEFFYNDWLERYSRNETL